MRSFIAFIKKEITEQLRSGRLMILGTLFILFGIMNPAVAKLTPWLLEAMTDSLAESGMFKDPIVTEIRPAAPFYEAEEYHQHFYKKNPEKYATEQKESGREDFIKENWQKK